MATMFALETSFLSHITHIVIVCAKPKVVRPNTGGIVTIRTIVQNAHIHRDFPKMDYPRQTMCTHPSIPKPQQSVSVLIRMSNPWPASVGFENIFPKSFQVIRRWFDLLSEIGKTAFRVTHNNTMFDFSCACSATNRHAQ